VAAVFEGQRDHPTVLFRAELDALPLRDERASIPTPFSKHAHLCGHDGHMVMVAGLAPLLYHDKPPCRVVLLFQPAEETGEGAARVLADPRFPQIKPDFAVALHNLPGFDTGRVVLRKGTFAGGSVGLRIALDGKPSHAAEPENAVSPLQCLCELPAQFSRLTERRNGDPRRLITITHMALGQPSFGVTPGQAVVFATLRSESGADLEALRAEADSIMRTESSQHAIDVSMDWHDYFPETRSDDGLVESLATCCGELGLATVETPSPFRWSEDFGHFSKICPSLYFGIGAGADAPGLHQNDYTFPDEIIPTGLSIYHKLIQSLADHTD
jgi:amidohydrolase